VDSNLTSTISVIMPAFMTMAQEEEDRWVIFTIYLWMNTETICRMTLCQTFQELSELLKAVGPSVIANGKELTFPYLSCLLRCDQMSSRS
jgi:hypothetical protein